MLAAARAEAQAAAAADIAALRAEMGAAIAAKDAQLKVLAAGGSAEDAFNDVLYAVQDNFTAPAEDEKWFVMEVIVEGKHVITKVDGKVITDFNEPNPPTPPPKMEGRVIDHGTFAIQGHDPKSKVEYKRIEVKPLP